MTANVASRPLIVLCLGSAGWGDEAIVLSCAETLRRNGLPVQSMRGDANDIADAWRPARHAIVIDTRKTRKGIPGSIKKISRLGSAIDAADVLGLRHEQNLSRALQTGQQSRVLPERITLLVVDAASFEWDTPPSEAALNALGPLTEMVMEAVRSTRAYRHLANAS